MAIKHAFTSAKADGGDATLIRPSNWNANHTGDNTLDRNLTQVDVVNTITETSVYSFTIGAAAPGADGGVRLALGGDFLNNTGVNQVLTLRVKLGATTVFSRAFQIVTDANRRKWTLAVWFLNSSASAQKWSADWYISVGLTDALAIGTSGGESGAKGAGYNSSAENTATSKLLDVTVQHGVANANLSFRKEIAHLILIPAS